MRPEREMKPTNLQQQQKQHYNYWETEIFTRENMKTNCDIVKEGATVVPGISNASYKQCGYLERLPLHREK